MIDAQDVLSRIDLGQLVELELGQELVRGMVCCPFHEERTPSFHVRPERGRWRCFGACDRGGDALDLVQDLHGLTFAEALDYLSQRAGLAPVPRVRIAGPPPATYPPREELLGLWSNARPVGEDERVSAWLASRGVDVLEVPPFVARALPDEGLPTWAETWASAHRLLIPLRDACGSFLSVKARNVTGEARAKELPPKGYNVAGLVYQNDVAAELLGGRAGLSPEAGVFVAEGGPDFLAATCALAAEQNPAPWAVIGLPGSGAWRAELAAKIPDGARVVIATDADAAGEGYAARITEDLGGRCRLLRAKDRGAA